MESHSRNVTEPPSIVSKSTVTPRVAPSYSFPAYLLPIDALEESTLFEVLVSKSQVKFSAKGLALGYDRGPWVQRIKQTFVIRSVP